jgi:purine-binding chemotaxis protein CheW
VVRGSPTPVIDLGRLCAGQPSQARRFVTLAVGSRTIALAVDDVIGLRTVEQGGMAGMPPLLRDASDAVTALGVLDSELLLVLDAVRLAPEALLAGLQLADAPS